MTYEVIWYESSGYQEMVENEIESFPISYFLLRINPSCPRIHNPYVKFPLYELFAQRAKWGDTLYNAHDDGHDDDDDE